MNQFVRFYTWMQAKARSEQGAGLAEYALLLFLIAVVCVGALTVLGTTISGVFNNITGSLN